MTGHLGSECSDHHVDFMCNDLAREDVWLPVLSHTVLGNYEFLANKLAVAFHIFFLPGYSCQIFR